MAIQDNASLALIPSGYKSGKLYSVIPDSGNGDFTHTRGTIGTRVNAGGFIETMPSGVPRLDYPLVDGVVQSCPALLLEPIRTNALPYSEDFSQWSPTSGITVTGSQFNELTGNSDAYKIETNGSTGFLQISETVAATSGNNTYSVFAKKGTNNKISLRGLSGVDFRVVFDLDTGTIDSQLNTVSSKIENYGSGWYRLSVVFSGANTTFYIYPSTLGTADAGNIYVYGAQLEAGTYETSYIPTSGSSVTRNADVCNGAGTTAEFNDTESSWFVELQGLAEDNTNKYITISDGGGSPYTNSLVIQYRNNGTLRIFHNGLDFADAIFVGGSSFDLTENHKIAIRFKENDMAVYIDGVAQSLSGSFVYQTISGLDTLRFEQPNGGNAFYGKIKQLLVFKTALSDSDLATLTS